MSYLKQGYQKAGLSKTRLCFCYSSGSLAFHFVLFTFFNSPVAKKMNIMNLEIDSFHLLHLEIAKFGN